MSPGSIAMPLVEWILFSIFKVDLIHETIVSNNLINKDHAPGESEVIS